MGEIKKQGISNAFISYTGYGLGALSLIFIQPRFLSPELIGLARVLFVMATLIATVIPFGAVNMVYRYFPFFRDKDKGHGGFLGFVLLYTLLGFLISMLFLFLLKEPIVNQYQSRSPQIANYFPIVVPLSFFLAYISVLTAYSGSLFKSVFPSLLSDIVVRVLYILLILVYYFTELISLSTFIYLFASIYLIQLLLLSSYIYTTDKPRFRFSWSSLKEKQLNNIIRYSFVISLATIASLGIKMVDAVFLPKYLGLELSGVYAVVMFIPTFIEAPVFSLDRIGNAKIASELAVNNLSEVKKIYTLSSFYLTLFCGFLFLSIGLSATSLVNLLPAEYQGTEMVIIILACSAFFNAITGLNNGLVFNSELYKWGTAILVLSLILTVMLNILLIPALGLTGAALATGSGGIFYNLSKMILIWNRYKILPVTSYTLKAAGIILFWFIVLFSTGMVRTGIPLLSIIINTGIAGVLLGISLWTVNPGGFRKMVKEVIKKRLPF